jgi:hypothetical protein
LGIDSSELKQVSLFLFIQMMRPTITQRWVVHVHLQITIAATESAAKVENKQFFQND